MAQLSKTFYPYDPLPAADLNTLVSFMNGIASGGNLENNAVTTPKIANGAVTASKIDFATFKQSVTISDTRATPAWGGMFYKDIPATNWGVPFKEIHFIDIKWSGAGDVQQSSQWIPAVLAPTTTNTGIIRVIRPTDGGTIPSNFTITGYGII